MHRAEWTLLAEQDLEEIAFQIGVQDYRPATAAKIVREIRSKCETYAKASEMGTAAPELGEDCRYFTHKRWVIIYTPTGEEWHICLFNAQPEAPAFFVAGPGQAGASGWALNESFSTGSGIHVDGRRPSSYRCG